MESTVAIGLDLGKSVFQVHGVDAGGAVVVQRRLTRGKLLAFFAKQAPCLVGMKLPGFFLYSALQHDQGSNRDPRMVFARLNVVHVRFSQLASISL